MSSRSVSSYGRFARDITVIASFFSILLTFHAHAQPSSDVRSVYLRGEVRSSGISGSRGEEIITLGNPETRKRGVFGIELDERGNHPCYIKVHRKSVAEPSLEFAVTRNLCGDRGPKGRIAFVGWKAPIEVGQGDVVLTEIDTSAFFVRGAEICANWGNDRLKGLRLFSTKIRQNGVLQDTATVTPTPVVPPRPRTSVYQGFHHSDYQEVGTGRETSRLTRTNCGAQEWRVPRFCGPKEIAVSVNVHVAAGSEPPRDIVGIELLCREADFGLIPGSPEVPIENIIPGEREPN
jgi:hypothetical protein